jgi:two-component system sensor histidine kinase AlgZ
MSEAATRRWLPQFCRLPTLFAVMLVAELVAVIVVLAAGGRGAWLARLAVVSVFVQWLALLDVVVLCSLRPTLDRLAPRFAFVLAWVLAVLVTALGSAVVHSIDRALGLGLSGPPAGGVRFVLVNAVLCALIAAVLLRYLHVQDRWRERVSATAKAEVDALQARIRPHFLFNSMNTIASLVRTRPAEAERSVLDLAELFRAALGAGNPMGTLGEEIDLIGNYLRLEQLRLGDRLRTEVHLDELPRDFPLPRLLLQPLVENAVYHGIQPLPAGGEIRIDGTRDGDGIAIAISNPLPREAAPARNGLALESVRARIGYHFGDRARFTIEQDAAHFVVQLFLPSLAEAT